MAQPIIVDNVEYEGETLSEEEAVLFDLSFDRYIAPFRTSYERTLQAPPITNSPGAAGAIPTTVIKTSYAPMDEISVLLHERKDHIQSALMIAKNLIGGVFKGVAGHGPELVISILAPWHILRKATVALENPSESWDNFQNNVAAVIPATAATLTGGATWLGVGQNGWIGWGALNATAANIDKRVLVCIVGFCELSQNRPARSVQFQVDNITFVPTQLQPSMVLAPTTGRVPLVPSKTYIFPPRSQVTGTVYADGPLASILVPIGVAIGQASYMNQHFQTTVTL